MTAVSQTGYVARDSDKTAHLEKLTCKLAHVTLISCSVVVPQSADVRMGRPPLLFCGFFIRFPHKKQGEHFTFLKKILIIKFAAKLLPPLRLSRFWKKKT